MDKVLEKLYCVHRHPIENHPACFANGKIMDKTAKKFEEYTGKPWYQYPGYRIGYFDIEVDNLNADDGTMLTWAVKEKDGESYSSQVTQRELITGVTDKRITQELIDVLKGFNIITGYYSTGFDLKFIRTRALIHGLDFPVYGDIYHFDIYYTVRSKLKLRSSSLGRACDVLGIQQKTHCPYPVWRAAKYGDKEALDTIREYNINDVEITEILHNRLAPFRKWTRRSL